jgi:UDP-N-acetylglucosamine transferase subunit ALG13
MQSRSLLDGPEVIYVRRTHSRDVVHTVANMPTLHRLMNEHDVTSVVSTGSAVAVSAMVPARGRRIACHYIESAARSDGPSLTGKLLARMRGVSLYTQYRSWENERWRFRGSVFDGFRPGARLPTASGLRVVVTLGTRGYNFRRLVERLVEIMPDGAEVLWQTGSTEVGGLPIEATGPLPPKELSQAMADADLVISHAGVGSALSALEASRMPLLVPRRSAFGEIVDDHQEQVARELAERDLAVMGEAGTLTQEDLLSAVGRTVEPHPPPAIELDPS